MLLKRIRLKNIRSYEELELEFREGSTLLAGDIGSGKSTILLSVEFALFGLIRSFISGETLLRHGCKSGEVELGFEVDNKSVVILRSLKRTNNGVSQDTGFFSVNDVKTDATPVEIKSKVLDLLGYPEDLVTKSKSLIYRYTVYTPQEEMKRILFMNADERLETIRKLFDIDKYKRVRENAAMHAKTLRAEVKGLRLAAEGISGLKEKIRVVEQNFSEKKKLLADKEKELAAQKEKEKKALEKYRLMEEEGKKLSDIKKRVELNKEKHVNLVSNLRMVEESIVSARKELEEPLSNPPGEAKDVSSIKKDLEKYKGLLKDTNNKLLNAKSNMAVVVEGIKDANKIISDVDELEVCPNCKQKVDEEHKEVLVKEEKEKIKALEERKNTLSEFVGKAENNLMVIERKIESLNKEYNDALVMMEKRKAFDEKKKRRESASKNVEELNKRKSVLDEDKKRVEKDIKQLEEEADKLLVDDKLLKELRNAVDEEREKTRSSEVFIARREEELIGLEKEKALLVKELKDKEAAEKESNSKASLEEWISKNFIGIAGVVEKHVLGSVHSEFSRRFEDWFNILLEDESITASLDDSFSPLVIQNGFDVSVEGLSGGEKTSVALAYRLALNKVVNDYMSTVKTRGVIILDEPTDGFSSEQLDKVRDVLNELNMRQTIIVSHDAKVESFVENIIRVVKEEHSSKAF